MTSCLTAVISVSRSAYAGLQLLSTGILPVHEIAPFSSCFSVGALRTGLTGSEQGGDEKNIFAVPGKLSF